MAVDQVILVKSFLLQTKLSQIYDLLRERSFIYAGWGGEGGGRVQLCKPNILF